MNYWIDVVKGIAAAIILFMIMAGSVVLGDYIVRAVSGL